MPTRGSIIVRPFQIRMARAALGWTIEELAQHAGIGEKTVRRMEAQNPEINMTVASYQSVIRCLEESGVTFTGPCAKSRGAGVCFEES